MALSALGSGGTTAYRRMLERLLPRGPAWDGASQRALRALLAGVAVELARIHQRLLDLIAESDPRTADELLPEWLVAWGLPGACKVLPADEDDQRAMLAAKVGAQGGQDRDYYIALAYRLLGSGAPGDGAVTIEERPYGVPFRVGIGRVGDPLNGVGAMFVWILHLPLMVGGTDLQSVIECLINDYKPAHTDVIFRYDTEAEVGP